MQLSSLFQKGKTVLSFEIFPPRRNGVFLHVSELSETLGVLQKLTPDFISVTFGAGGSPQAAVASQATLDIAACLKHEYGIEPLVHLTGLYSDRAETEAFLDGMAKQNLWNVLALRGDAREGFAPKTDFPFASSLIAHIRQKGPFHISAACYPEGHPESPSRVSDLHHLRQKVEAGASHLVSQLVLDNDRFYAFWEDTQIADIRVPIEAGVMPIVNKAQAERMIALCGASLPPKFKRMLSQYESFPEALRDAGIAYAIDQMADLMAQGVDGIHLYTMNNPAIAARICDGLGGILKAARRCS